MTKQQVKNDQVKTTSPEVSTVSESAKPATKNTVWLANKTKRPIHIMQRGKDEDGNNLANIRLSTLGAVEVSEETLKLNGVQQLLANKSLAKVTETAAKKLNVVHDAVITTDDAESDDENEEED